MEKNRIEWLDISKFIAISIMIAGHIGLPRALSDLIHIFHMPAFFIFSGLVFDEKKYKRLDRYIVSRAKGLLVPYFVYAMGTYVLYRLIPSLQDRVVNVKEFIILVFSHNAEEVVFNGFGVIQWFFTSLFFASIFSWIIIWICNKISTNLLTKLVAVVCLIIVAAILDKVDFPNILGINSAVLGCAFFIIGNISRKYFIENITGGGCPRSVKIMFLLSIVILIAVWCLNGSTNMRIPTYNNILLYTMGALSGTCIIIGFSVLIEKWLKGNWLYKVIIYEGQNTVIILALNRVVQRLMMEKIYHIVLYPFLINSQIERYVYFIFGIIMELILFIPVIYLVNRFIPFSVGKKKGNRK